MLSEKTTATGPVPAHCDELNVLSTDPEVIPSAVLLLTAPGFGNFVVPPKEDAALVTVLIGSFSVSKSCVFLKTPAAPNGTSMHGFRIVSGAEPALEVSVPRSMFMSSNLKNDPCFTAILQKIIGTKIDDCDSILEKYDLFEIMQGNMKDVHLCSAISFALAILSLKRPNTVLTNRESVKVVIQALRVYKDHPQICLHLTCVVCKNAIIFMEDEEDSKALFGVILDILTGNQLDVNILNNLLSILTQYDVIENNDKLVRFVVNLLRNESEKKSQKTGNSQREQAVKGLLAVLKKISKNEGGPYLVMYAGGVELLATILKKAIANITSATASERSGLLENITSIVSIIDELSKNGSICVSIVRSGTLPPLFRTAEIFSGDTNTLAQCCGIINSCSQVCCNEVAEDFAKYDGVRILTELLSNSFDSVDLAHTICSILSDITDYENIVKKALGCNCVEEVIRALDRHGINMQFCELVCVVLTKLTNPKNDGFAQSCEAVTRANGVASILWALERHQKAFGLLVLVSNVLANITQNKDVAGAVLDEDGVVLLSDSFRAGNKRGQQNKRATFLALKCMSQVMKNIINAGCEVEKLLEDTALLLNVGFEFAENERISFGVHSDDSDVEAFKNSFLETVLEAVKFMSALGIPVISVLDSEYHAFPLFVNVLATPAESGDIERKRLVLGIMSCCASAPNVEGLERSVTPAMVSKILETVNSCSTDVVLCTNGIDAVKRLYDRGPTIRESLMAKKKYAIKVLEAVLQKNAKGTGTDVLTLFGKAFELIEALVSVEGGGACKKRVNLERVLKVMVKVVLQVYNTRDFTSYGSEWEAAFYKMFLRIVRRAFVQDDGGGGMCDDDGSEKGGRRLLYRYSKVFRSYDGIDFLVKLLKKSTKAAAAAAAKDIELSFLVCDTLELLSFDYENQQKVVNLKGISVIVNALSSNYEDTKFFIAACKVLQILALDECEAMELAIQILREYPQDHGVIRGACALIANLSLVEENISLVVEYGLVRTLASVLSDLRKEGDVQQQAELHAMAISALTNITKFSVGKEEFVEKCNGIQLLTELFQDSLSQKDEYAPIFDGVYSVFANIVFDERYIKRVVTDEFVSETVSLLNFYLANGDSAYDMVLTDDDDNDDDDGGGGDDEEECGSNASTDEEWDDGGDDDGTDGSDVLDEAVCNAFSSICAFLTNISIETEYQVLIAWKNGIPPIVDSLGAFSDNSVVCDKSCSLLRNLSLNGDNRREIADNGGIHRVLSVLERHSANPAICANACGVIANLLLDKDVAALAARENAICTIAAAVRHNIGDSCVCERGCAALLLLLKSGCRFAVLRAGVCVNAGLAVLKRLADAEDAEKKEVDDEEVDLVEAACGLVATGVATAARKGLSLKEVFELNPWLPDEFRQIIQSKSGGLLKWFKLW